MSRFIEMLKQTVEGKAQRIGFGASLIQEKRHPILLVARLDELDSALASGAAKNGADAVILTVRSVEQQAGDVGGIKDVLGDTPWGALSASFSLQDVEKLKELGCDFIVFEAQKTPSTLLEEGLGKILLVTPTIQDSLARMLEQLSVDAVLIGDYEDVEPYITVQQLMNFRRIITLSRQPLIVSTARDFEGDGLGDLRDAKVGGIVLTIIDADSEERLQKIRKAIQSLPPSRRRPTERETAILPSIGAESEAFEDEEEE